MRSRARRGTVFRNYLCQNGKGQGEEQIDCLADVATVVDNAKHQFWRMSNGYALPGSTTAMAKLSKRFNSQEGLIDAAEAALRVGVHWETSVAPPAEHRVAQVYASALPVAYSAGIKAEAFEPFARLSSSAGLTRLRSPSDSSRLLSSARFARDCLPDGARWRRLGNRIEWIYDALKGALDKYRDAPLDVKLVHYGSAVPPEWVTLDQVNAANESREPFQCGTGWGLGWAAWVCTITTRRMLSVMEVRLRRLHNVMLGLYAAWLEVHTRVVL